MDCLLSWASCWGPWQGQFIGSAYLHAPISSASQPAAKQHENTERGVKQSQLKKDQTFLFPLVVDEYRLCRSSSSCQNPTFLSDCLYFSPHPCFSQTAFKACGSTKQNLLVLPYFQVDLYWVRGFHEWRQLCDCSLTQLSGICQNLSGQVWWLFGWFFFCLLFWGFFCVPLRL